MHSPIGASIPPALLSAAAPRTPLRSLGSRPASGKASAHFTQQRFSFRVGHPVILSAILPQSLGSFSTAGTFRRIQAPGRLTPPCRPGPSLLGPEPRCGTKDAVIGAMQHNSTLPTSTPQRTEDRPTRRPLRATGKGGNAPSGHPSGLDHTHLDAALTQSLEEMGLRLAVGDDHVHRVEAANPA